MQRRSSQRSRKRSSGLEPSIGMPPPWPSSEKYGRGARTPHRGQTHLPRALGRGEPARARTGLGNWPTQSPGLPEHPGWWPRPQVSRLPAPRRWNGRHRLTLAGTPRALATPGKDTVRRQERRGGQVSSAPVREEEPPHKHARVRLICTALAQRHSHRGTPRPRPRLRHATLHSCLDHRPRRLQALPGGAKPPRSSRHTPNRKKRWMVPRGLRGAVAGEEAPQGEASINPGLMRPKFVIKQIHHPAVQIFSFLLWLWLYPWELNWQFKLATPLFLFTSLFFFLKSVAP